MVFLTTAARPFTALYRAESWQNAEVRVWTFMLARKKSEKENVGFRRFFVQQIDL
jgi:hypothetical protein